MDEDESIEDHGCIDFEYDFTNSLQSVINVYSSLLMRFQQEGLLIITRLYNNLLKPKCLIENDVNIE